MAAETVTAAKAKAELAALVSQVAYGGKHFIIERRGKPMAALVKVEELEFLEQGPPAAEERLGFLALVGAWKDVGDAEIDALIADIYAERKRNMGRPVNLEN